MKKVLLTATKVAGGLLGLLVILYLIFYIAASGDHEVSKTVAHDSSIPHIILNKATFHAETYGSDTNQVVIIIHGGPGNDFRYLLDLKKLATDYFVVFYDQRGTGLSPRVPAEEITVDNMIEDLHAIATHYGKGEKVNIIGHSWGGMLASAYLGRYPETVHKIVLAEPGPLTPERAKTYSDNSQPKLTWELLVHLGKSYFKSLHVDEIDDQAQGDYFFTTFTTDTTVSKHPLAGYFCNQDVRNANFEHWRYSGTTSYELMIKGMQGDMQAMNFVKGVKQYPNKVLFLVGACNILIGSEFQEKQTILFNNTQLVVIPDAGHFMFSEQPEASMAAVRSYFEE